MPQILFITYLITFHCIHISLDCFIAEFTHDQNVAFKENLIWNIATNDDIQLYKCKLIEILDILDQIDISNFQAK